MAKNGHFSARRMKQPPVFDWPSMANEVHREEDLNAFFTMNYPAGPAALLEAFFI